MHPPSSVPELFFLFTILYFVRSLFCCLEIALFPPSMTHFCFGGNTFASLCIPSALFLCSHLCTELWLSSTFFNAFTACSLFTFILKSIFLYFFPWFVTWIRTHPVRIRFFASNTNLSSAAVLLHSNLLEYLRITLHYLFLYPKIKDNQDHHTQTVSSHLCSATVGEC